MGKFDLASVLSDVSKLDTGSTNGRERIEYIPLELIDPDPNNFYELSEVAELAANIELIGLQQPLRVRTNPDQPGHVMLVSGHRRRAALELLVKDGNTKFAEVPCIKEEPAGSAALQELRLIYANSDTRKISSAELGKQAERVEFLLYQLKEEGVDFPGRMRDHVAEACKVSKTKLARLKVIRENLDKPFIKLYEKNRLKESTAYALAQQPVEIQRAVYQYKCTGKYGPESLFEYEVKHVVSLYKAITEQKCPKGGGCDHASSLLGKIFDDSYSYKPCEYSKCCNKCERLASCKTACPKLAERIKKLKADNKEAKRQEQLAKEEAERPAIEQITALWARFGQARQQAGKSVKACMMAADRYYVESDKEKYEKLEQAAVKITKDTTLPYGYSFYLSDAKKLIQMANCLGCSLDYLFCRTDEPALNSGSAASTGAATWTDGVPRESGLYVMKTSYFGVEDDADIFRFDADTGSIYYPNLKSPNEGMECLRYIKLPED